MKPGRSALRRQHALSALLGLEVFILFIGVPIAAGGTAVPLAFAAVPAVIIIAILLIISPGVTSKLFGAGAVLLGLAGGAFRINHPSTLAFWLGHGAVLLAILAITLVVGRVVFGPGRVTSYRLQGAVVLYLNIGVAFTTVFRLIADLSPAAFTGFNPAGSDAGSAAAMLYFSFTTLTSQGFGDILPVHPFARGFANLEAIIGQLYIATVLARLVTLHTATGSD